MCCDVLTPEKSDLAYFRSPVKHTMVGKKLMMAVRLATIALLFISEPSDTAVMSEIFLLL